MVRRGLFALASLALVSSTPLLGVNLVVNPGFSGSLAGWSAAGNVTFDSTVDSTGTPGSGSAKSTFVAGGVSTQLALSECITAGQGSYTLGGKIFIPNGQAVGGQGLVTVSYFSAPGCSTGLLGSDFLSTGTTGSFVALSGPITAPAGTVAIWITGQNNAAAAGTHIVNYDDFVLDDGTSAVAPTIAKSFGAPSVNVGGQTSLTFTLSNPNKSQLTGLAFTDTLPSGLVVATPNGLTGSCGGGTITATAGSASVSLSGATLAGTAGCTFSVQILAQSISGTVTNTTSTLTSNEAPAGTPATATLSLSSADLSITMTAPLPLVGGQNVTYTITVTNNGPTQAAAVTVNDPTPPFFTFVSNTGGCTTAFPCNLGALNPNQTVTIQATFKVPANFQGSTNTATVSSTTPDPNAANNTATFANGPATTPVPPTLLLALLGLSTLAFLRWRKSIQAAQH